MYTGATPTRTGEDGKGTCKHENNLVEVPCSEMYNSGAQAPGRQDAKTGSKFQAAPRLSPTWSLPAYGVDATKNSSLKGAGFTSVQT